MNSKLKRAAVGGVSIASLMLAGAAPAAPGTLAGSTINNTASVGYSIGGVAQPTVNSTTASFVVDRKVNVTVAEVGGTATFTSYGQKDQVTTFTVTNNTNSVQDFRLFGVDSVLGTTTTLNHTDSTGVTNIRVFVDSNGNGQYDAGVDTATYIDELAPDQTKTVFIVADLPASGPAGGVAGVILTAVTASGGASGTLGADVTASLVDDVNAVDTVFGDAAGWADAYRDARHSAQDEYDVYGTSALAVKTATLISDPLNGLVAPKAIPGAVMEYCIAVKNIGVQAITGVTVTDNIPANTTYVPGSTHVGGTVLLGVCQGDGVGAADGSVYNGTAVTATIPTIAPNDVVTARFRVTIN
ncbi:hypothetical protein AS593_00550 [Caulobacter vibrioides]|nr:hypothetical protein AS593_00550 [Caulobacter vibrioides]